MAGGYELAKAYVTVLASTKGAGAQIVSEIGDAGDRAGSQAGTKASARSLAPRLRRVLTA